MYLRIWLAGAAEPICFFFSLTIIYFSFFFLVECSHSFVFAFFPEMTVETSAGEKGE